MNCTEVRHHLPSLLYGDLKPAEAAEVEEHLRVCARCCQEYAALRSLPPLLDAMPAPAVHIDLSRLYQEAAKRLDRRARRWRRIAMVGLAAAAAAILLVAMLRIEVRLEAHQVVVRWGAPPEVGGPAYALTQNTEFEDRLRVLAELTQAVVSQVELRDRRQQQEIRRLHARFQEIEKQWHIAAERDLTALYVSQFMTTWSPLSAATQFAVILRPRDR